MGVPGRGVAARRRLGFEAGELGAVTRLGRGELGGLRPLRSGTYLVQPGGERLVGLRRGPRLGVPGRGVAARRRLGFEAGELGAVTRLGRGELGGQRQLRIGTYLVQPGGERLVGLRLCGRLRVPGRGVAFLRRLGFEAGDVGAVMRLGQCELGGQRPLRIGTYPVQLGGERLVGLRFGHRLRVPGRGVAFLRRVGLEASDVGAVPLLGRGELGGLRPPGICTHPIQFSGESGGGLRLSGPAGLSRSGGSMLHALPLVLRGLQTRARVGEPACILGGWSFSGD